jgi:phosphate transporter
MGGGLAIREAMLASNFLAVLQDACRPAFATISTYPLLIIVLIVVCLFASCMNSTVAAAILYPLVAVVGRAKGQERLFVCLAALMVSGAQLFHMSTFANSLVYSVRRHIFENSQMLGVERFLTKTDFPYFGWPTIVVALVLIGSLPYGIVHGLNAVLDSK